MATFTSSSPGDPNADPNALFNLGQDLQTAQGIQGTSQKLAFGQQALADQQTEVGLRGDVTSSDPSVSGPALNQLAGIDPAAATAQLTYKTTQASLPLQRAQAMSNFEANGLRAVTLSSNPQQAYEGPGGYVQHMASMGIPVPPTYDPAYVTSGAFSGMSADDFAKYKMTIPQYGPAQGGGGASDGAAPGGPGPTTAGAGVAPSPANNNPGNLKVPGGSGFQTFSSPAAGDAAAQQQLLIDNTTHGLKTPAQIISSWAPPSDHNNTAAYIQKVSSALGIDPNAPVDLTDPVLRGKFANAMYAQEGAGVPGFGGTAPAATQQTPPAAPPPGTNQLASVGLSATPAGSYTPGGPGDQVSPQQPDAGVIDVTSSGANPTPTPAVAGPGSSPGGAAPLPQSPVPPSAVAIPAAGPPIDVPHDEHGPIPSTITLPGGQTVTPQPADRTFEQAYIAGKPQMDPSGSYFIGRNASTGQPAVHYAPGGASDPLTIAATSSLKALSAKGFIFTPNAQGLPQITGAVPGSEADVSGAMARATQQAANTAAVNGPGALLKPLPGPIPEPPIDPLQDAPNNEAGAAYFKNLADAGTTAMSKDNEQQESYKQDAENAQDFIDISKKVPTGPYQGSAFMSTMRAAGLSENGPAAYQELDKLAAQMQTSGLPKGFSRLDIPIVRSVTAAQPGKVNVNVVNQSIASSKIARDNRQSDYIQNRAAYAAQHHGVVAGFDRMWNDYNDNVATTAYVDPNDPVKGLMVNAAAPPFDQWSQLRADPTTGKYQPALAKVPDATLQAYRSGGQPQAAPGQAPAPSGPTDMRQAAAAPSPAQGPMQSARYAATHPDETSGLAGARPPQANPLAALEGHVVQQNGHSFLIQNGQAIPQ